MDDRDRPGVATYVVVIGVIAMLSLVALVFLGGQTSQVLMTVSGTV